MWRKNDKYEVCKGVADAILLYMVVIYFILLICYALYAIHFRVNNSQYGCTKYAIQSEIRQGRVRSKQLCFDQS